MKGKKMWEISKDFACCYGHRVHNQKLDKEYSLDTACVCRHLHGHQMSVRVHLCGDKLKDGMVTDFKHLNWFKKFIDDVIDHKFLIDKDDPLFSTLLPDINCKPDQGEDQKFVKRVGTDNFEGDNVFMYRDEGYWILNPMVYKDYPIEKQELYEGYVVVPFVPTSENISAWFYEIIREKMKKLCKVSRVEFWETPKSRSQYAD